MSGHDPPRNPSHHPIDRRKRCKPCGKTCSPPGLTGVIARQQVPDKRAEMPCRVQFTEEVRTIGETP